MTYREMLSQHVILMYLHQITLDMPVLQRLRSQQHLYEDALARNCVIYYYGSRIVVYGSCITCNGFELLFELVAHT